MRVLVEDFVHREELLREFVGTCLQDGLDYGSLPDVDKRSLFKPGAEKLLLFFSLAPTFEVEEKVFDWTGEEHGGEPLFYIKYKCTLRSAGEIVAEGHGSCNSWEAGYRRREAKPICPSCKQPTIFADKHGDGFYCWRKRGGCGMQFTANDAGIVSQPRGVIANPDIHSLVNTIDKMAQKRALIQVTLIATGTSGIFTQDVEDFAGTDVFGDTSKGMDVPEDTAKPVARAKTDSGQKIDPNWFWSEMRALAIPQKNVLALFGFADLTKVDIGLADMQKLVRLLRYGLADKNLTAQQVVEAISVTTLQEAAQYPEEDMVDLIDQFAKAVSEQDEPIETEADAPEETDEFDAADLRDRLLRMSLSGSTAPASERAVKAVVASMDRLLEFIADNTARNSARHAILKYLFGNESSKDLAGGQTHALLSWMCVGGEGDDKWNVRPQAKLQAVKLVEWLERQQGQKELEM